MKTPVPVFGWIDVLFGQRGNENNSELASLTMIPRQYPRLPPNYLSASSLLQSVLLLNPVMTNTVALLADKVQILGSYVNAGQLCKGMALM
jgi:hypothetical protein